MYQSSGLTEPVRHQTDVSQAAAGDGPCKLKEAEKRLELERLKMEITKTGLLWKLRTQTQRHALELFLFNCWERFQKCSVAEIEQIRSKIQKFPRSPKDVKVSVASWDVLVTWCILPSVTLTRETS